MSAPLQIRELADLNPSTYALVSSAAARAAQLIAQHLEDNGNPEAYSREQAINMASWVAAAIFIEEPPTGEAVDTAMIWFQSALDEHLKKELADE